MKPAAAHTTTKSVNGDKPVILSTLGKDLASTAWRIAVPVILAAVIGIIMDRNFGTAPWLTLVLALGGFFVAGWLVKKQLAVVQQREDKKS